MQLSFTWFRDPVVVGVALLALLTSCSKEATGPDFSEPNVPAMLEGRPVEVQGTVFVGRPNVTFKVWDSGTIDGDIISLHVNGNWVLRNYTLTGSKFSIPVTLNRSGYSYVLLYAHNVGSIPPNTAALSIDDGTGEKTLVLSANLSTNGAYNIVVQ